MPLNCRPATHMRHVVHAWILAPEQFGFHSATTTSLLAPAPQGCAAASRASGHPGTLAHVIDDEGVQAVETRFRFALFDRLPAPSYQGEYLLERGRALRDDVINRRS